MPDFIPAADDDFHTWVTNLAAAVSSNPANYGETALTITDLTTAMGVWSVQWPNYTTAQATAASATAAKEDARDDVEAAVRALNGRIQARGEAVTAPSKETAGFPVYAESSGPIPAPVSAPLLRIDSSQRFRHTLSFRDAANPTRRGKPEGVMGCKLFLKVGPTPPASPADCQFIALDTASPYLYEFPAAQAGQTAWWMACWVNPRQEDGPCSETVSATIPG
jgi:hypothetical protein